MLLFKLMSGKVFKVLIFLYSFFFISSSTVYASDITAPVTTYSQTPELPDGNNDWFTSVINFSLEATDIESGIKEIKYRIDGGTWQTRSFLDSLNLLPNPSFEVTDGASSTGLLGWETILNADTTISQDLIESLPNYGVASLSINSTAPSAEWRSVNNQAAFAVTTPYDFMTASAWVKTENVTDTALFKVYAIYQDEFGTNIIQQVGESSPLTGTNDWTKLAINFTVSVDDAFGVFMDIGLIGSGQLWVDAVVLNSSSTIATANFSVGSDSENHTVEYYSIDHADNAELYDCDSLINCIKFKSDVTPPGNWYDAGAFRSGGNNHELFVYTNVLDDTAGISENTNNYQYKTDNNTTFGYYTNLSSCSSVWNANQWRLTEPITFTESEKDVYIQTPRTNFCNSNWRVCKIVRFYAEDVAGNSSTKDFCINGPWISFVGGGFVGTNANIDMVSEAPDDNTDSLIESGGNSVSFFSSSEGWKVVNSSQKTNKSYDELLALVGTTTSISVIPASSGVYKVNGDFTFKNTTMASQYYGGSPFNQIIFVDGDATIEVDIRTADATTALYIVNGDVFIDEDVDRLEVAIIASGTIHTAYNAELNKPIGPLSAIGIYIANSFSFQRTLQGLGNTTTASERIRYEPKYLIQLKPYFKNNKVRWKDVD